MDRRSFVRSVLACGGLSLLSLGEARAGTPVHHHVIAVSNRELQPLDKPKWAWREFLDEAAWDVLFRERTERAFSSPLNRETRDGTYLCAACFLPLFSSATKFESGTGWPSFYQPFDGHVGTKPDRRLIWPRIEYHCIRCEGHQGHVFDDGPEPTGQRWCNNGLALRFISAEEPLPELRG